LAHKQPAPFFTNPKLADSAEPRRTSNSPQKTNSAMRLGITQEHCTVVLTLSPTPVPARNRRVYALQSKCEPDSRQQTAAK
jgi:hypothetical protein